MPRVRPDARPPPAKSDRLRMDITADNPAAPGGFGGDDGSSARDLLARTGCTIIVALSLHAIQQGDGLS